MAFLVVQVPGAAPASIPLLKALTTIGSGADCDVRLGDDDDRVRRVERRERLL